MVLHKTSFYYSKTMVFEDWRFPKSKEILQESHIKIGPKRVCKNEAKVSQKGAKVGAINRQFFEKNPKKGVPKIDAKKGRICEAPKSDYDSNAWGRVAHSGPAGRDLGRGTVTCLLVLGWISSNLKTLCSPVGAADPKSTKIDHGAVKVRLIHRFYRFWPLSKKTCFFDRSQNDQK